MNSINIQYFNERIEIIHSLSNKDLKKKIDFKKDQLKKEYPKNIIDFNISWFLNNGEGFINIFYNFKEAINPKLKGFLLKLHSKFQSFLKNVKNVLWIYKNNI